MSLEPEPIPLEVKVVLVGQRLLYYLLHAYDPEFAELFKVAVDFEEDMPRGPENDLAYARVLGDAREARKGCGRSSAPRWRASSSRARARPPTPRKLSVSMQALGGSACARPTTGRRSEARSAIAAADVQRAVDAQEARLGRVRERVLESVLRGTHARSTPTASAPAR